MKWLFLVHQVRTTNSRERVRVWRLTKKVGTILYRNSVYVLPYSKERLEDFQWLSQQIRDSKGEASVFVSEAGDAGEDRALKEAFIQARVKEYGELEKRLEHFVGRFKQVHETPSITLNQLKTLEKALRKLENTFDEIRRIDFFRLPLGNKIAIRLKDLRRSVVEAQPQNEATRKIIHHSPSEFRGKAWATRAHIHIDRLCSAWLIKRFIDPKAKFIFAPEEKLPRNAILFDVFRAEFTHRGDCCTFETLLEAFGLKDKALWSIGELVHEIDLKDHRFNRPESAGLDMVVRAISDSSRNDEEALELGSHILDAVFARISSKGIR